PDEEAILARVGGEMSERLVKAHMVRLMLWSGGLGVSSFFEDWASRTEGAIVTHVLRGGVDWFGPPKRPGQRPPWAAGVLQEAAKLLAAVDPRRQGRRGVVQEALRPLLEWLGVPAVDWPQEARKLSEAVRRRRARITGG